MASTSEPLALARRRFTDAVGALVDPQPVWVAGACRWLPPVYVRVRDELQPRNKPGGRRRVPDSRLPCRTDALVLVIDIDMTAAEWQPKGDGTMDRLNRLRERSWAPEDCELLDGFHDQLARWAVTAAELLGDSTPTVALRLPCPSCGTRFAYRRNGVGEPVRVWALQVSEHGCRCQACRAEWQPEQFEFLARLLGLPALPAA